MNFDKDFSDHLQLQQVDPYDLRPECILVDKVFDSCFQRECEPSKVVDLPCPGKYEDPTVVYGPGFIVDGSLSIKPTSTNFARVRFLFRVPFTVKIRDASKNEYVTVNDFVEFHKDVEVYLPQAASEFSFSIIVETRSETLRSQVVGDQVILGIGVFVVVKVIGRVQLLVQAFGYCPPPRECVGFSPDDVCEMFDRRPLPDFFPEQLDDLIP